jgi:hypothetical protein
MDALTFEKCPDVTATQEGDRSRPAPVRARRKKKYQSLPITESILSKYPSPGRDRPGAGKSKPPSSHWPGLCQVGAAWRTPPPPPPHPIALSPRAHGHGRINSRGAAPRFRIPPRRGEERKKKNPAKSSVLRLLTARAVHSPPSQSLAFAARHGAPGGDVLPPLCPLRAQGGERRSSAFSSEHRAVLSIRAQLPCPSCQVAALVSDC